MIVFVFGCQGVETGLGEFRKGCSMAERNEKREQAQQGVHGAEGVTWVSILGNGG